jgi:hypothetical protein
VLGGIGIIGAFFNNYSIEMLLTNALFLVIWAWVLNWLCSKGFKAISWILVLLPFVFFLFMYFLAKDVLVVREGAQRPEVDMDRITERVDRDRGGDDGKGGGGDGKGGGAQGMTEQQKKERQAKIDKAVADENARISAGMKADSQKYSDDLAKKDAAAKKAKDLENRAKYDASAAANAGSSNDPRYNKTAEGAKEGGIAVGSAVVGGINPVAGAVYDYASGYF